MNKQNDTREKNQAEMDECRFILRLTPVIRRRIYQFVGLVPWDSVKLPHKFDLHGRDAQVTEQPKPNVFHGLLLSCRTIYAEAAPLLYSTNRFILHYAQDDSEPLMPLHALTATSLASLTNLTIVLNQASCHQDFDHGGYYSLCCLGRHTTGLGPAYHCKGDHANAHNLPLLAPNPTAPEQNDNRNVQASGSESQLAADQDLIAKWHSAATHLSHITSGRLDLGLVCDIDPLHKQALDVAISVITPLTRIPQLRACHVRLSKTPDPHLQQTAQDVVSKALCIVPAPYSTPSTQTTLITLPAELRLRILEYTGSWSIPTSLCQRKRSHGAGRSEATLSSIGTRITRLTASAAASFGPAGAHVASLPPSVVSATVATPPFHSLALVGPHPG
jgi:hypothetical protein